MVLAFIEYLFYFLYTSNQELNVGVRFLMYDGHDWPIWIICIWSYVMVNSAIWDLTSQVLLISSETIDNRITG